MADDDDSAFLDSIQHRGRTAPAPITHDADSDFLDSIQHRGRTTSAATDDPPSEGGTFSAPDWSTPGHLLKGAGKGVVGQGVGLGQLAADLDPTGISERIGQTETAQAIKNWAQAPSETTSESIGYGLGAIAPYLAGGEALGVGRAGIGAARIMAEAGEAGAEAFNTAKVAGEGTKAAVKAEKAAHDAYVKANLSSAKVADALKTTGRGVVLGGASEFIQPTEEGTLASHAKGVPAGMVMGAIPGTGSAGWRAISWGLHALGVPPLHIPHILHSMWSYGKRAADTQAAQQMQQRLYISRGGTTIDAAAARVKPTMSSAAGVATGQALGPGVSPDAESQ